MSESGMPRGALVARYLTLVWGGFAASMRDVPGRAWRRWVGTLLVGYALSCGVAVLCVQVARGWVGNGLQAWDERTLRAIADSPMSFPQGLWFEAWGSSAFLIPMVVLATILFARHRLVFRSLTVLVAYFSIKGLVLGSWQLWNRARPEMIADGIASPGLHSFPSGHAVNSMVLFGLLGVFWWVSTRSVAERVLLTVLMGGVIAATCLGRVRLGTHWPSDIVAGLIIGGCWLLALAVATLWAERTAER